MSSLCAGTATTFSRATTRLVPVRPCPQSGQNKQLIPGLPHTVMQGPGRAPPPLRTRRWGAVAVFPSLCPTAGSLTSETSEGGRPASTRSCANGRLRSTSSLTAAPARAVPITSPAYFTRVIVPPFARRLTCLAFFADRLRFLLVTVLPSTVRPVCDEPAGPVIMDHPHEVRDRTEHGDSTARSGLLRGIHAEGEAPAGRLLIAPGWRGPNGDLDRWEYRRERPPDAS